MKDSTPVVIRRDDYRPPPYLIERIHLWFDLDADVTRVRAESLVRRCKDSAADAPLVLDGQVASLEGVYIDGRALAPAEFTLEAESLTIAAVPASFVLRIDVTVRPSENTALEGLYVSGGNFCTQCEAEGFRRITYMLDRPDVMARYTTTIRANKRLYPVLLSNGNLIEQGDLDDGRHFAAWEDPFPKPSYLFALVAGDLARRADTFTTRSGREVALHVYVAADQLEQTTHCLASLKRAMKWDEDTYGREYDLDTYMIVAVRDFNMGAMENKGLNIFNTKYVLASPDTATDTDFTHVEAVVAHEYFHNWSGNRVTCRDWFQLSLKEGFTVFRDQEFSADVGSRALKRIQDVARLQSVQFPEDQGPTAHPVRPDSYVEINNFYTATVYEKGAEVVRMIHTLLGPERFRRGTDLYFERHDGQAVTCDDFVRAMEDASGVHLGQFRRWYEQAGTPTLHVSSSYDAASATLTLTLTQHSAPTPGQPQKHALHIPVRTALLDAEGNELACSVRTKSAQPRREHLLELTDTSQTFVFDGVSTQPTLSLLRGFSAPVRVESEETDRDLLLRMAKDGDAYSRWEASQSLARKRILQVLAALERGDEPQLDRAFIEAFRNALASDGDPQLLAASLVLPGESLLADTLVVVDPSNIHHAREFVQRALARENEDLLRQRYEALRDRGSYTLDAAAMGRRALSGLCLRFLTALSERDESGLARAHFESATNMTDAILALALLADGNAAARPAALASFYARYEREALVIDKWFSIQAMSRRETAIDDVMELTKHPAFSLANPNRARALLDAFAGQNPYRFHDPSGRGYTFLADRVLELDRLNPQVAARLALPLTRFLRLEPGRRTAMILELQRMLGAKDLSRDVYEQVSRALRVASEHGFCAT
jgi:aminopeptidase N